MLRLVILKNSLNKDPLVGEYIFSVSHFLGLSRLGTRYSGSSIDLTH